MRMKKENKAKTRILSKSKPAKSKIQKESIFSNINPNYATVAIVIITVIIFYIITLFINGDINLGKDKTDEDNGITLIQYVDIIAGTTFNQPLSDYYVIFFDSKGSDATLLNQLISTYKSRTGVLPYYVVDLNSGFNKSYISNISNPLTQSATDLKINGPTLIRITNHLNAGYFEGITAINNVLNQ